MKIKTIIFLFPFVIAFYCAIPVNAQDTLVVNDSLQYRISDSTDQVINIVVQPQARRIDSLFQNKNNELDGPPSLSDVISFGKIIWTLIIIAVAYFVIKYLTQILEFFAERSAKYRIMIKGIAPIIRVLGWSIVIYIIIAGIIKPPQATVIAFTASLGVAIAFASQDILKNIFAGIVIIFDRPFSVGDKIEIGSYYGEVIEIGLRTTRIVTPDDSMVAIPNAELMNQSVSNANSGEPNCQVVAEIYLPIKSNTSRIREVAIEAAQVSQYVYLNKPISVIFVNEVKERRSYYKMRLKAYVMDIRYEFAFKSDMTEIVIRELINKGLLDPDDLF